jgi:large subunit ribosomal protein L35
MPKLKTNRAANKRFRRSASGGFKRARSGARHLAATKNAKRVRSLRTGVQVDSRDVPILNRMLPYA